MALAEPRLHLGSPYLGALKVLLLRVEQEALEAAVAAGVMALPQVQVALMVAVAVLAILTQAVVDRVRQPENLENHQVLCTPVVVAAEPANPLKAR